ncbi:sugar transferase [Anaeromyxobacter paludicola]|uniref:UDP-phosphate galactose phosphotransferase n=1 Tax=Anaeromyxobacter paludicola TaxID=2918171 RepID=A0ABN6N5F3_9BACT|nr:sugar transferase [Anaeromyxobacter paludicola]BDG07192.1 UDP-phosphate galactose phosphotransferase [Anaeromyxobacter paludicola]
MLKQQARLVSTGLRLWDLCMLSVAFPIAYRVRDALPRFGLTLPGADELPGLYPISRYYGLLVTSLLLWIAAARWSAVYQAYRTRPLWVELWRIARSLLLVAVAVAAIGFALHQSDVSRSFVAVYYAVVFALVLAHRVGLRLLARAARRRGYNTRSYAVVGSGDLGLGIVHAVAAHPHWGLVFAGWILEEGTPAPREGRVLGGLAELGAILEREVLDEVVFAVPREQLATIEQAVHQCEEQGVGAKVCLDLFPRRVARLELEELEGVPVLSFTTIPQDAIALFAKRAFDIVVSALVLLLGAPVFLAIAAAVKLDSRGPVFFRQRRVGLNGREFTLLKFRSMVSGAERLHQKMRRRSQVSGPVYKHAQDPRITPVGRWLRRTSLDELPQFWNVLKGEMSVVGPRPPIPEEVREYQRWQRRRLSMKPGITCTWQVSGRSEIDFERWMALDLAYIDNWSLWLDLRIFLLTIPAVLTGRGAR